MNRVSFGSQKLIGTFGWHSAVQVVNWQPEMEYCASTASVLREIIWRIAEGVVEVPANL